jgi:hypothetical protein
MYCRNCAIGDMLNEEANAVAFYGADRCKDIKQAARDAHAICEDPKNCTCRHIIGLVLSAEEVSRMKSQYEPPNYAGGPPLDPNSLSTAGGEAQ